MPQLLHKSWFIAICQALIGHKLKLPVALGPNFLTHKVILQPAGRRNPIAGRMKRAASRQIAPAQKTLEIGRINALVKKWPMGKGDDFARKSKTMGIMRIKKRLFPKTVTGKDNDTFSGIKNRHGEHTVKKRKAVTAISKIGPKQCLRVRMAGCEDMPVLLKTPADLKMVVDLTVVNKNNTARTIPHGLLAAGKINDGQAPVSKMHRAVCEKALSIWASMREGRCHGLEMLICAISDKSGNTTHNKIYSAFCEKLTSSLVT